LLFLYNTGARVSEATQMRVGDLQIGNDPLKRATEVVGELFAEKRFAASEQRLRMDGDQIRGQQKLDALSLIRDNA
jgi:integrase